MRALGSARLHQRFAITHRDGHVAGREHTRTLQRLERFLGLARSELRLAERRVKLQAFQGTAGAAA